MFPGSHYVNYELVCYVIYIQNVALVIKSSKEVDHLKHEFNVWNFVYANRVGVSVDEIHML